MDSKELYQKYSESYMSGNSRLQGYHDYRIRTFLDLLNESFDLGRFYVVDYGCGDGVLSDSLSAAAGYRGIDPSPEMIRLAQAKGRECFCGGLDALDAALSDESLAGKEKILVCLNTLPYMSEDEVHRFFSIASAHKVPVVVSHTNELLDLVSYNRYTLEHRRALLPEEKYSVFHELFANVLAQPEHPPKRLQTEVRFGQTNENSSERDTIKKYRVDPFSWPSEICSRYGFGSNKIQPIRVFAFPPAVMEQDDLSMAILHSDAFDGLGVTYRLIFCSQFRVVFFPG